MKILIIDDHILFLQGLQAIFSQWPGGAEITTCNNIEEGQQKLRADADYDIVLADMHMPGGRGALDLLEWIRKENILIPLLVVSASENPDDARMALSAGAFGYIEKSASWENLQQAVNDVIAGKLTVPNTWADILDNRREAGIVADENKIVQLSPRHMEILPLIKNGCSNREIAQQLALKENTVKGYVKDLYKRLGVNNRTECLQRSELLGLFDF